MPHWMGTNRRGLASSAVGRAVWVFALAGRSGTLRVDCCSMRWCGGIVMGMLHIGTWGGTAFRQGREGWAQSNDAQGHMILLCFTAQGSFLEVGCGKCAQQLVQETEDVSVPMPMR